MGSIPWAYHFTFRNPFLKAFVTVLIPDYKPKMRYKVTGEYNAEHRSMYFDMTTAEESLFRVTDK